ncbi:MAG: linked oxidase, N-terminal [Chthonomonadales bacterium]|nr:linked oxidase, N-terminal [Chthonomonadales bacterium]
MLSELAISAFRAQLRGELIQPEDALYEEARKVYNAMIDKRPAFIARCVDVADVIAAVNFGRDNQLTVAIRGGGHNGPGFGTCDDGLVIDLSRMRGIRVDPTDSTVRVEGGCVWGDVDHATHAFGLAVPCGFIAGTGVGGLTLGGGIGYLSRKYGLTIDNLLGVDMVLADGRFVTANAEENPDLFWAVRGGGGNFGVVTSFLFQGRPVSTVYGGPMFWPMEKAAEMLRFWQEFILDAPDDMNGWFACVTVPPAPPFPEQYHLQKMCAIVWCSTGPSETAIDAFKLIREFCPPAIDFAGPIPFPALQGMFDALYPAGLQWYWRADFFHDYDDKAIDLHTKYGAQLPTMHSTMHIYPINGAAGRVGAQDTAWGYRDANFAQVIVGVDPDPQHNERLRDWSRDYWLALHPYSVGGGYVNMIMDEGEERVKAAYGDNYSRLARTKAKYDPQNLFHVNQNIKPTT